MAKANWAGVLNGALKNGSRASRVSANRKISDLQIRELCDKLAATSPDRRNLFLSPEFQSAAQQIATYFDRPEAGTNLARLCNALVFSKESVQRQTLAFRIVPAARRIGKAINAEAEDLKRQLKELRDKGHRNEERELREATREIWSLKIKASRLEEKYAQHGIEVPGLEGGNMRHGVTAKAALAAHVAREVFKALPQSATPTGAETISLIASLLDHAGIQTTPAAVKSAVQVELNRR